MATKALNATNNDDYEHVTGDVLNNPVPANDTDAGETWFPSADDIFAIDDVASEVVRVPEWKDRQGRVPSVLVYSLDGAQRDKYQSSLTYMDKKGRTQFDMVEAGARLLVLACRKQDGSQLFTRFEIDRLQKKNSAALDRLATVARRLSRLDNTDDDEEKRRREGLD